MHTLKIMLFTMLCGIAGASNAQHSSVTIKKKGGAVDRVIQLPIPHAVARAVQLLVAPDSYKEKHICLIKNTQALILSMTNEQSKKLVINLFDQLRGAINREIDLEMTEGIDDGSEKLANIIIELRKFDLGLAKYIAFGSFTTILKACPKKCNDAQKQEMIVLHKTYKYMLKNECSIIFINNFTQRVEVLHATFGV